MDVSRQLPQQRDRSIVEMPFSLFNSRIMFAIYEFFPQTNTLGFHTMCKLYRAWKSKKKSVSFEFLIILNILFKPKYASVNGKAFLKCKMQSDFAVCI